MNLLITGANGQLGSELQRILAVGESELGPVPQQLWEAKITALDLPQMDIVDIDSVRRWIVESQANVVINCAAYTNVDGCEGNPDGAFRANALGPRNMAIACEEVGAKLIHVSTDYVFDGAGDRPYREWDQCNPQSIYGTSKLLGEQYAREFTSRYFVVRTAWLYGYQGGNFVKTMLRILREKGCAKVVDDQRGCPTNTVDLAHHLLKLAATEEYGVYHCIGNGECSWYEFTCEIAKLAGLDSAITPCTTEEFPRPAKRPVYSVLDNMMLRNTVGDEMRHWKDAIAGFMKHYNQESGEITL